MNINSIKKQKIKTINSKQELNTAILKVIEETTELNEVLLKYLTKSPELKPPLDKIIEESGDVFARLSILVNKLGIVNEVDERFDEKINQIHEWVKENGSFTTVIKH